MRSVKEKIIINSEYEFLRDYIRQIPRNFYKLGTVIEDKRNIIREDCIDGKKFIIKSYRKIYLANRIRYSFFAPSKAQRAFNHAEILLQKGFKTPTPVAYIEVKKHGLITESFFISEYLDFFPLNTLPEYNPDKTLKFLLNLSRFTYKLHQNGIFHRDYSLGNILCKESQNDFEFALVDNNRMSFGPISFSKRMRNLVKLGLPVEHLIWIIKEYARLQNADEVISLERLFHYKRSELAQRQRKQMLKMNVLSLLKSFCSY
jgi:serine/threonine protein kinase